MLSRRRLLSLAGTAGLLHCGSRQQRNAETAANAGRIGARVAAPVAKGTRGSQRVQNGTLFVPESYDERRPSPLIVALHGAGGNPASMVQLLRPHADRAGAIVLAPKSAGRSWDLIQRRLGPDVERIEEALNDVFSRYAVDAKHVAVSGFSDGASYALSIGLANGELFTHILAFSPGFVRAPAQHGRPHIYVSHGTRDGVLPVDACSRVLVPRLQAGGYRVMYREFDGAHAVPMEIATEAFDWFVGS